jgi:F-type H+-transporting ATPase subunit b
VLIDWFTVAAQAVNFVVLVWLLRRFLYGPITRAMEERQRGIDEQIEATDRLRDEAAAEGEQLRAERERFDAEREERERALREELDDERRAALAAAREEADQLRDRWRAAVERERDGFLQELRQEAGGQIIEVSRSALRELADEHLETRVIERFLLRLDQLDDDQRRTLEGAADGQDGPVEVRTAFEVPDALQGRITDTVRARLEQEHRVVFTEDPRLLCGIELRVGGYALAWSLEDHLDELEAVLAAALGEGKQP